MGDSIICEIPQLDQIEPQEEAFKLEIEIEENLNESIVIPKEITTQYDDYEQLGPNYSIYMNKCKRSSQQDRFSVQKILNDQSYFGVFDGHGSDQIAQYLSEKLHINLEQQLNNCEDNNKAIRQVFQEIDQEVLQSDSLKAEKSGSVVLCTLIDKQQIKIINLGDSKAVVYKEDGTYEVLNNEHIPSREDELQRLNNLGGVILKIKQVWRLQGEMAISRSIGDGYWKNFLISEPEIKDYQIQDEDAYLIIGTDGIWNELNVEEIGQIVQENIKYQQQNQNQNQNEENQSQPSQNSNLAFQIYQKAKAKKYCLNDNATIIAINLNFYKSSQQFQNAKVDNFSNVDSKITADECGDQIDHQLLNNINSEESDSIEDEETEFKKVQNQKKNKKSGCQIKFENIKKQNSPQKIYKQHLSQSQEFFSNKNQQNQNNQNNNKKNSIFEENQLLNNNFTENQNNQNKFSNLLFQVNQFFSDNTISEEKDLTNQNNINLNSQNQTRQLIQTNYYKTRARSGGKLPKQKRANGLKRLE